MYYSAREWQKREARHLREGFALIAALLGISLLGYHYQEVIVSILLVTAIVVNLGLVATFGYRAYQESRKN
jgi:hypothetical protein